MKNWMLLLVFGILYLLVTFFGLGPVLLADGTGKERMITLAIVLLIYAILTLSLRWILRMRRKKS